ncbi:hypothetical protein NECAME_16235 [Necator americanus]|uniref:Uncharacterized protein n=1 Tax=Necator americanus TaxID=51031 RepID=W2TY75_NECAM|nr:hypothetical protein NECAME_16235 [Necator americanus]ETN86634.1 hypothetical protein NECAME_16235 [Necator americanus]
MRSARCGVPEDAAGTAEGINNPKPYCAEVMGPWMLSYTIPTINCRAYVGALQRIQIADHVVKRRIDPTENDPVIAVLNPYPRLSPEETPPLYRRTVVGIEAAFKPEDSLDVAAQSLITHQTERIGVNLRRP